MKKFIFHFLSAVILLSSGIGISQAFSQPQIIQAATSKKKLQQKAYVYTSKGKTIGVLPKGTSLKVFGSKTIKKVAFYKIGSNQYVKKSCFSKPKKKTTKKTSTTSKTKINLTSAKKVISYLNKKKGKKDWFVLSGTSDSKNNYYVLDSDGHTYIVSKNGTIKKIN